MASKSFKQNINPAMKFISETPQLEKAFDIPKTPPEGYKLNPVYIERRTKHLQGLVTPSLWEKLKKCAAYQGISVNEFVHVSLENATDLFLKGEG
jgi:hypothetical protein